MEVLNTGEELGRQILEDARKKASRMLEAVDRECAAIRDEGRKAVEAEIARLRADGDRQAAAMRAEMQAALPLDFLRTRLGFIQDTVSAAVRSFLEGLSARRPRRDPRGEDPEGRGRPGGAHGHGAARGHERRARACRRSSAPPRASRSRPCEPLAGGKGVEIESDDGRVRFRCTTAELEAELLEERREELAVAVLGREALEAGA